MIHEPVVVSATITGTPDDVSLAIRDARVTLDEKWAPYIRAELVCWTPSSGDLDDIDPRDGLRVVIEVEQDGDELRAFDLALRVREIDHTAGIMRISAESDEALLRDFAQLTTAIEYPASALLTSLRSVCGWALGKIGATLAAGTFDRDMSRSFTTVNLFSDGGAEYNTQPTVAFNATVANTNNSGAADTGNRYFRVTRTAIGSWVALGNGTAGRLRNGMEPGQTYRISGRIRGFSSATPTMTIGYHEAAADGLLNNPIILGTFPVAGTSYQSFVSFPFTVSEDAEEAWLTLDFGGSGWVNGDAIGLDNLRLSPYEYGDVDSGYFDGSTPDDAYYQYEWNGVAGQSSSTRYPLNEIDRDAFGWEPGTSLWDWVSNLVTASGGRLYCDEERVWHLVESAQNLTVDPLTIAAGVNLTDGSDRISLDDTAGGYTGVALRYDWTGRKGVARVRYDTAGTGPRILAKNYRRPFPGAGVAQTILDLETGFGRDFALSAVGNYDATPGQPLEIELPANPLWLPTGTVVTNYHANPFMVPARSLGANQTGTTIAFATYGGLTRLRAVTTVATQTITRLSATVERMPADAGDTVYARVRVTNGAATARAFDARLQPYTGLWNATSLGTALTTIAATQQIIPAGGSAVFEWTGVMPATAKSVLVAVTRDTGAGTTPAVGDTFYVDAVHMGTEPAPAEGVFSGDTPDDAGPGYAYEYVNPAAARSTRTELVLTEQATEASGYVSSVEWSLPDNTMRIGSRLT